MEPTFSDVADSPLFRARVDELDGNLERLKDRTARLQKGTKKYAGSLEESFQSTTAFADSIEKFCGSTDEESMLTGAQSGLLPCSQETGAPRSQQGPGGVAL